MEIRTKHVRAGFAAGLEGLKAMEIGAKQYDKEGALFWSLEAVPLRQLRLKILARQHRHQLLQVQPYWDFNNSII